MINGLVYQTTEYPLKYAFGIKEDTHSTRVTIRQPKKRFVENYSLPPDIIIILYGSSTLVHRKSCTYVFFHFGYCPLICDTTYPRCLYTFNVSLNIILDALGYIFMFVKFFFFSFFRKFNSSVHLGK